MSSAEFVFPSLPIEPISAGQTLLVIGPGRIASQFGRKLIFDGDHEDGIVFVSTGTDGRSLAADFQDRFPGRDLSNVGIIDATGQSEIKRSPAVRIESVSNTGDLTGISIKSSILSTALQQRGVERIRYFFDSLSLLCLYTNFRTTMRFVHTVDGRVAATRGLGVFVLDPSMHDPQVEYTLKHVCDGAIEIRQTETKSELRIEGFDGQPSGWHSLD